MRIIKLGTKGMSILIFSCSIEEYTRKKVQKAQ
jgi:hypothetical protein